MAPEYGATMGFFPVDEKTIDYFEGTGRTKAEIAAFENYFKAQKLFGVPKAGDIDYTKTSRSTSRRSRRRWPARSARRTASRSATSSRRSPTCSRSRSPKTASTRRRTTWARSTRRATAST
jgi:hypothetical protein